MVYILPNGKELKRGKGIKNKMSPAKTATVHRRLLAILFDISEISVSRQFAAKRLSLRNPYAVKKYIEDKLEYNGGLKSKRKEFRGTKPGIQDEKEAS